MGGLYAEIGRKKKGIEAGYWLAGYWNGGHPNGTPAVALSTGLEGLASRLGAEVSIGFMPAMTAVRVPPVPVAGQPIPGSEALLADKTGFCLGGKKRGLFSAQAFFNIVSERGGFESLFSLTNVRRKKKPLN
jgi:hypothetical protein